MPLILRAIALNDRPLSQPITGHFGEAGGSIGRADSNTLALPDPERHISRVQAEVSWKAGAAIIRNVGGPNPVLVNGRLVDQGASAVLDPGGNLQIGGYRLQVEVGLADVPSSTLPDLLADPLDGKASPSSQPAAPSPRGRGSESLPPVKVTSSHCRGADDPFDGILDDLLPPPGGIEQGSAAIRPDKAPPKSSSAMQDPFAAPVLGKTAPSSASDDWGNWPSPSPSQDHATPSAANAGVRRTEPGMTWLDELAGARPSGNGIEHLLGTPSAGSDRDPVAGFLADDPVTPASAPRQPIDDRVQPWNEPVPTPSRPAAKAERPKHVPVPRQDAQPARPRPAGIGVSSGSVARSSPPAEPAAPQRAPHVRTEIQRPAAAKPATAHASAARADPPSTPPRPPAQKHSPAEAEDEQDAPLWQAFCDGAGIEPPSDQAVTPQQMRELGALLRASVYGVHALVAMRAHAKGELGSAVTQIRATANNPLKFSVDARAALEQLIRPPVRGFLAGPAAMQEACDDVLAHAIGTVAGMQAALKGVLDRFEPAILEGKLSNRSMLETVLPGARKARLWELYVEHARSLREEASEDFNTLFGKAFRKAYDAQIDRIADER